MENRSCAVKEVNKVILVIDWIDGFGNDEYVKAVCTSVEEAKRLFPYENEDKKFPIKYKEVPINKIFAPEDFPDYYQDKCLWE